MTQNSFGQFDEGVIMDSILKIFISNRVILNTKGFASGVYFVVLTNGLKSVSKQFVIQK
jgi:hypothetical protein